MTKSVTSALVGIAVQDGDLALVDHVSRYVRAWRGTDSAAVTVRNLLANDSGRFWSLQSDYVTMGQAPNRTKYAVGARPAARTRLGAKRLSGRSGCPTPG